MAPLSKQYPMSYLQIYHGPLDKKYKNTTKIKVKEITGLARPLCTLPVSQISPFSIIEDGLEKEGCSIKTGEIGLKHSDVSIL